MNTSAVGLPRYRVGKHQQGSADTDSRGLHRAIRRAAQHLTRKVGWTHPMICVTDTRRSFPRVTTVP